MMTNHTKGPWVAHDKRPHCDGFSIFAELDNGPTHVAFVGNSDGLTNLEADAALIAAAPNMFLALQNVTLALLDEIGDAPIASDSALAECLDAIDKATGNNA